MTNRSLVICDQEKALNRNPGLLDDPGLLDLTHDLIIKLSPDGLFLSANQIFYDTLGYQPGQLDGRKVESIVASSAYEELETGLATTRGNVSMQGLILAFLAEDGREHHFQASLYPREAEDGEVVFAFLRSMSEQEAVREALRESEEKFRTVSVSYTHLTLPTICSV